MTQTLRIQNQNKIAFFVIDDTILSLTLYLIILRQLQTIQLTKVMSEIKLQSPPKQRMYLYRSAIFRQSTNFNISDTTCDHFCPTIL